MDTRPAPAVFRRAPARPPLVRELVFDRLPAAVQGRLTRSIVDGAPPDPLLASRSSVALRARSGLIAAMISAAACGLALWMWDLGSLRGRGALQPPTYAAAYGASLFITLVAGAAVARLRRYQRGAPFPSGRYLFSLDLVEVAGGRLRVTALDALLRVEARSRGVALVFEDEREITIPLAEHADPTTVATKLTAELEAARARSADDRDLERLDPFYEMRVSDDWAAAMDTADARPRSALLWATLGAAIAAAPAGYGLLRARNAISDDLMFNEAITRRPGEPRGPKLAAYVERGQRHHGEMAELLIEAADGERGALERYVARGGALGEAANAALFQLTKGDAKELAQMIKRGGPRAAEADEALFALVKARDDAAQYAMYLEVGSLHADEVKRELLPEADWKQASRSPLVGPLASFVRRNPGSRHEAEAWRRIHEAYAEVRARYRQETKAPPDGQRFTEALLASLEDRADPRVDLVIPTLQSEAVATADAALSAKFGARYLAGAGRFSPSDLDMLQFFMNEAVVDYFASAFPRGAAAAAAPDDVKGRPRIEITIAPVPSGYSEWRSPIAGADAPKYVTPLIALDVQVRGVVPGRDGEADTTLAWRLRIEDASRAWLLARTSDGIERAPQQMINDAYGLFLLKVPKQIAATLPEHL